MRSTIIVRFTIHTRAVLLSTAQYLDMHQHFHNTEPYTLPCCSLGVAIYDIREVWNYVRSLDIKRGGRKICTEHDELGHTYTSGIYLSVLLIRACMAIVVAVVGVKDKLRAR